MGTALRSRLGQLVGLAALLAWTLGAVPRVEASEFSDHGWIQLAGSLLEHRGEQTIPSVTFKGLTENNVGLSGGYFWSHWGGYASVEEEGLKLTQTAQLVQTTLLRARIGPAARFLAGPVELQAFAAYGYARAVAFRISDPLRFAPLTESQVVLGAWASMPLFWKVSGGLRAEVPVALSAKNADGKAHAYGILGGASLLAPVFAFGTHQVSLGIEYTLEKDWITLPQRDKANQVLQQFGAFARLEWPTANEPAQTPVPAPAPVPVEPKKEAPKLGSLDVVVVNKETLEPIAGAKLMVGAESATTSETGQATFENLPPGAVSIAVSAPGYRVDKEGAMIVAGVSSSATIGLQKSKKQIPAYLQGIVRSTALSAPVRATVEIPELHLKTETDESGSFSFRLNGGLYTLIVSSPGYVRQVKNVVVKDGDEAIYNIDLHPEPLH